MRVVFAVFAAAAAGCAIAVHHVLLLVLTHCFVGCCAVVTTSGRPSLEHQRMWWVTKLV